MKKIICTTLFILLINQNLPSQTSSAASKLMDFFKSRKLYNSFIRHAETVNNNFFFAYSDKAFINNPYTHQNLFFAHLNAKGEIISDREIIYDHYEFSEGFEFCYSNNEEVKILAGLQGTILPTETGIIGTYNIGEQKFDVQTIKNIVFAGIQGAYDREGNFHIIEGGVRRYVKMNGNAILINKYLLDDNYATPTILSYNRTTEKLRTKNLHIKGGHGQTFYYDNKLYFFYYILDIENPENNRLRKIVNNYNKIGIHVFNLDDYQFEELRIYNIDEIAAEKITGITYPEIKLMPEFGDDPPVIYVGGEEQNENYLYKINLDADFNPIPAKGRNVMQPVLTESFPEDVNWDFTFVRKQKSMTPEKFYFIGIGSGKSKGYYYFSKDFDAQE